MLILLVITYGFGLLWIGGIAFSIAVLIRACNRLPPSATVARAFGLASQVGAAAFGAYWAWLIIATCKQLVFEDGGPGPFGMLAFPFWSCIAVAPALLGGALFTWLSKRLAQAE
jgi:hypothetical protein